MKKFITALVAVLMILVPFQADSVEGAVSYQNPPVPVINKYLTDAALKFDVPPEIVKAIAMEESGWQQFKDGQPYISEVDGRGIGIMQITDQGDFDQEKLKTDIKYNIEIGVKILDQKFRAVNSNKLPTVNDNDRHILESWYFAVLAYNGQVQKNSPIYKPGGQTNTAAYQEKVYTYLNNKNPGIGVYPLPFNFKEEDFTYTGAPKYQLIFEKDHFEVPEHLLHESKYFYKPKDVVFTAKGANFREAPSRYAKVVKTLPSGVKEAVTILEDFEYDQSNLSDSQMLNLQYVWYKVQLKDGTIGYTASNELEQLASRISGANRFETAVAISQEGWTTADTVVLAKGYDFPDALAGTPLAHQLNAPMLLTRDNLLPDVTKDEITRLKAKNVILLGSTGAINAEVEQKLKSMGLNVERYGGKNRFETAIKIAEKLPVKGDTAVLAYGYNFPDALSIAAYAAKNNFPIFLTRESELSPSTEQELKKYKHTIVVGSESVVNSTLFSKLNDPKRYGGKNRYETNAMIVNQLPLGTEKAYIAFGYEFADALTGAVLAAKNNSSLLLSNTDNIPEPTRTTITGHDFGHFSLLGGTKAINIQYELGELVK
ncbi:cell wall-binding repeat-containing protein [Bacillus sp. ISL-55]|uniref:cell wall-binding repeat-containing protein n=1 Tax=Bacillus sp. ISL-55 TaxID=2819134 RepID=UPI001BE85CE7|nr:cell wall-binding repeat-containing protein [Bacillus sp. ISL-55]MBT2694448.1 cell wall-binding repeat-containing protein [Bacillus sp. ISL-55]